MQRNNYKINNDIIFSQGPHRLKEAAKKSTKRGEGREKPDQFKIITFFKLKKRIRKKCDH